MLVRIPSTADLTRTPRTPRLPTPPSLQVTLDVPPALARTGGPLYFTVPPSRSGPARAQVVPGPQPSARPHSQLADGEVAPDMSDAISAAVSAAVQVPPRLPPPTPTPEGVGAAGRAEANLGEHRR